MKPLYWMLLLVSLFLGLPPAMAGERYDMGTPVLQDLWVDPRGGSDRNTGASKTAALRTLRAAWDKARNLGATGYRINILPGTIPFDEASGNYFEGRRGTLAHPLIVRAVGGPRTVTIVGGLNIAQTSYLYLLDLGMVAGGGKPMWGNNVLHLENCDHVLMRGLDLAGPDPAKHRDNYDIQETLKANQCAHLYLEDSDLSGAFQTGVDYFSVQRGHVAGNRIHGTGEWGMYVKGGSAYLTVTGNEFARCGLGFQAGEGSTLNFMRAPWVHYEAYDVKFTNNVLHDIPGVGMSVAGGYNVLLAYNTLYKVGTSQDPGYGLVQLTHGARSCDTAGAGRAACQRLIGAGAWGSLAGGGEWIPNRNVFVFNNLLCNPAPLATRYAHFDVRGPATAPGGSGVPNPSLTDTGARFMGNVVWNGPPAHPLGLDQASPRWLSEDAVRRDNAVNRVEPRFVNPAGGDFRLASGLPSEVRPVPIPDFSWSDAPSSPAVPPGRPGNAVPTDRAGRARAGRDAPGAYSQP